MEINAQMHNDAFLSMGLALEMQKASLTGLLEVTCEVKGSKSFDDDHDDAAKVNPRKLQLVWMYEYCGM